MKPSGEAMAAGSLCFWFITSSLVSCICQKDHQVLMVLLVMFARIVTHYTLVIRKSEVVENGYAPT